MLQQAVICYAGNRRLLAAVSYFENIIKKEILVMKKTRFLVLALVVAVMLMGAGYAWWNDTITVRSTVTTGNLDVDIVGQTVTPDDYVTMDVVPDFDNTFEEGDNALVKFINIYPGKGGIATLTFKNKSTMAVKLDKNISFAIDPWDGGIFPWPFDDTFVDISYTSALGGTVIFKNEGGVYTYDGAQDIVLEPDATATFTVSAKLPEAAGNETQKCENIGFVINPNFIQWNQVQE